MRSHVTQANNFTLLYYLRATLRSERKMVWDEIHGNARAFSLPGYCPAAMEGMRYMRLGWLKKTILAASATTILTGSVGLAQTSTTDEGKRKVKTRVSPSYPELARRMSVSGKVKIEVVITPDGHVRSTRVVGGHPLLVQACQDAVREWKFGAAPEETTQVVEFEFRGLSN
jgi:TonB family protein